MYGARVFFLMRIFTYNYFLSFVVYERLEDADRKELILNKITKKETFDNYFVKITRVLF